MGKGSYGRIDNFAELAQGENRRLVQALRQRRQATMDKHEELKRDIARSEDALQRNSYEFRALNQAYCEIMDASFRRNCSEAAKSVDALEAIYSSYKDKFSSRLARRDAASAVSYDPWAEFEHLKEHFLQINLLNSIDTAFSAVESAVASAANPDGVKALSQIICTAYATVAEIRTRQPTNASEAWSSSKALRDLMEKVLIEISEVTDEIGYQCALKS